MYLCRLKIILRLENRAPPERIQDVGLGRRADQRLPRVIPRPHQLQRVPVLRIAQPPPEHHERQPRDRPSTPAKRLLPRSNLAIRQPQNPGNHHRQRQRQKNPRGDDEDDAPRMPPRIEREERPHPVIHRVIQQDVAQRRNQRAEKQPAP